MHLTVALMGLTLAATSQAHSWVEQLNIIAANGTMIDPPGFPRGNALRGPGVDPDLEMVWLLPPNGRSGPNTNAILTTDKMCKPSQTQGNQTPGSPALVASPGDMVALRYQENGHVTLPDTQIGKPPNRGTVFIYGTTKPSADDTLLGIHKVWNADGTGGDRRGVLLATRNYDDGQCYQVNGGSLSVQRQAQFQHTAAQPMGVNIWCQSDVTIPATAPTTGLYTMYWVWDWPTLPGTAGFPNGKNETYTTCMDISMKAGSKSNAVAGTSKSFNFKSGQDLNFAAVADQLTNAFQVAPGSSVASPSSVSGSGAPSASEKTPTPTIPGGAFAETSVLSGSTSASRKGNAPVTVTVSVPVTAYITVTEKTTIAAADKTSSATLSPLRANSGSIIIPVTTASGIKTSAAGTASPSPLIANSGSIVIPAVAPSNTKSTTSSLTTKVPNTATPPLSIEPFTVSSMIPKDTTTLRIPTRTNTLQTPALSQSVDTTFQTSASTTASTTRTTSQRHTVTEMQTKTLTTMRFSNSTSATIVGVAPTIKLRSRIVRQHAHRH